MRTFSKLKALCAFPETLEKPSKRRDDAAAIGNLLHKAVEVWTATGDSSHFDALPGPVRGWAMRMKSVWTPPEGCETEVAVGLADLPSPVYVPVKEDPPDSHDYKAMDGRTPLLTAGRADLVWLEDGLLSVVDIKTGQFYLGDPWLLRQLQAQAIACSLRDARTLRVRVGVYYARLGLFDWGLKGEPVTMRGSFWEECWREVVKAAKLPAKPMPGAHCLSCWSKKDCPDNPEVQAA